MTNAQIAELLTKFADLLDIKGESGFRVNAYRRAADTIQHLDEPVSTLIEENRLTSIKGIGKGISTSLGEIVDIGEFADLEALQDEIPGTLLTMLAIPGIGPKSVGRFYRELALTNLEDLEQAARQGLVRSLKGMGARQEERILEGIAFLRQRTGRISIGAALPAARELSRTLGESLGTRVAIVGSVRRGCETVGNIDLLVDCADLTDASRILQQRYRGAEVSNNADAIEVMINGLCSVRLIRASAAKFGSSLVRATGSRNHVEALEQTGEPPIPEVATEQEVYSAYDLRWIPPELRENRGEIEAAARSDLPELVDLESIRGDLHLHSNWSDGRATILELADRARELGYEFLSIADHSHSLAIANGLNEERLRQQWLEIREANEQVPGVRLLRANEVEVRRDGSLDFPDDLLAELDLVVASLHSGRNMSREDLTERLLMAVENPHVDIIGHPTGRIIDQRPGADYDWERIFKAAARTRTALEINANPARLDLPEQLAREAVSAGVLIAINTDAHDLSGLDIMEYGVAIARRGWVPKDSVINTWDRDRLLEWLNR
jgi:DNA polymerase (family X)